MRNKKEAEIIQTSKAYNARFKDPTFAPSSKSLIGDPPEEDNKLDPSLFFWGSAEDIFGRGKYSVFNDVDPTDIQQGYLGDCYLLCAISSLAERPSLIYRLFDTDQPNDYGVYAVWLNIDGLWREIIMDDYFPVIKKRDKIEIAFSQTTENELWPLLLEKAYAKVYGNYSRIDAGFPLYALRDLTGAPYKNIDFDHKMNKKKLDALWKELVDAERRGWICVCGTENTSITEEWLCNGLISGHAYSLLDAQEVVDSRGKKCRIVLIRNPHGETEWNGDWSDNSRKWTPQLRKRFSVSVKNDGLFWMGWKDFVKHFESVGFCKVEQNYMYNAIEIKQRKDTSKSIARFDIKTPGRYTISVDQKDPRFFSSSQNYTCSFCRITIGRLIKGGIDYVDCKMTEERNIFCGEDLRAGKYVVLIEMYWESDHHSEFVLSAYGTGVVGFKKIAYNAPLFRRAEYFIWKDFCYTEHASDFKRTKLANLSPKTVLEVSQFMSKRFGVSLTKYSNSSRRGCLEMSFRVTKCQGYEMLSEFNSGADLSMKISPGSHEVIIGKIDPRAARCLNQVENIDYDIHDHDIPDETSVLVRLANIQVETPIIDIAGNGKVSRSDELIKSLGSVGLGIQNFSSGLKNFFGGLWEENIKNGRMIGQKDDKRVVDKTKNKKFFEDKESNKETGQTKSNNMNYDFYKPKTGISTDRSKNATKPKKPKIEKKKVISQDRKPSKPKQPSKPIKDQKIRKDSKRPKKPKKPTNRAWETRRGTGRHSHQPKRPKKPTKPRTLLNNNYQRELKKNKNPKPSSNSRYSNYLDNTRGSRSEARRKYQKYHRYLDTKSKKPQNVVNNYIHGSQPIKARIKKPSYVNSSKDIRARTRAGAGPNQKEEKEPRKSNFSSQADRHRNEKLLNNNVMPDKKQKLKNNYMSYKKDNDWSYHRRPTKNPRIFDYGAWDSVKKTPENRVGRQSYQYELPKNPTRDYNSQYLRKGYDDSRIDVENPAKIDRLGRQSYQHHPDARLRNWEDISQSEKQEDENDDCRLI